jgi:DALR anticodon binding domain
MALDTSVAVIQYPSLVQWLADRLGGEIALHPEFDSSLDFMHLPLFKAGDRTFGTFSSPLLLQLLKRAEVSRVQALGEEILNILRSEIGEGKGLIDSALAPPAPQTWGEITEDMGHFSPSLGSHFRGRVPRLEENGVGQCNAPWHLSKFCKTISPTVWITPAGWLYAEFSPHDLTTWLQSLIPAKPILLPFNSSSEISNINPKISADPVLFNLQHAHARCHSLLRLAEQEKFLPLEDLDHYFEVYGPSLWQTENGALHLQTKAEQAILLALMQFPQSLSPQKVIYGCSHPKQAGNETRVLWPLPTKHLYRHAIAWSQLFSNFHRDCRLFGAVQKNTPQVALARFALVYIVKKVLAFLLEVIFQITAPLAL